MTVRCARLAMATRFEFLLVGDGEEHLMAVGEAALDEVARIERLLSRYNPASEVARINRAAAGRPVRVDRELFAILKDCRCWFDRTNGYFDICATGQADSPRYDQAVELDPEAHSVRFLDPSARLDFGGYGKGYALDRAARVLDEFGVGSALLSGGTSSILARGRRNDGLPWRVALRDPSARDLDESVAGLELTDRALSSSAALGPESEISDIIDPSRCRPLESQAACSVVARSAAAAEALSTAALAMGKEKGLSLIRAFPDATLVWIDGNGVEVEGRARVGGPHK